MSSKIHICNCSRCGFRFSRRDDAQSAQHAACVELVEFKKIPTSEYDGIRSALKALLVITDRIIDATNEVTKETDGE